MKTLLRFLSFIFIAALLLTGCAKKKAEGTAAESREAMPPLPAVKMVLPAGAPVLAAAPLIADETDHIEVEIINSPPLLSARIIGGEADAAIVPSNLAAVLSNKNVDIKVVGGVVWGILYVVTRDGELAELADLRGKELTLFGRGLTPDIVFRHLLREAGLDPDTDLTLNYLAGVSETAASFIAGQTDYALLAEPVVTRVLQAASGSRIGIDLQKEWAARFGSLSYPQAVAVVVGDKWNDARLTEDFIGRLESALGTESGTAVTAALPLMPEYSGELLLNAYERCNIAFKDGGDARTALANYYQILFDSNPQTIGGTMPDETLWQ